MIYRYAGIRLLIMLWKPQYIITDKIIFTMRKIGEIIGEIRSEKISAKRLHNLEHDARIISNFVANNTDNTTLSIDDITHILSQKSEPISPLERAIFNYNQSLIDIDNAVSSGTFQLSVEGIIQIQTQLTTGLTDTPDNIHFRQTAAVIHNSAVTDEIVFIPPYYKYVPKFLEQLVGFVNNNIGKIDPIILAGIFHRQHIKIHPFATATQQTTHLLTKALLGTFGLGCFQIFSFENIYNQNINRYFKKIGLTSHYYDLQDTVDFTEWLEYFSEGILNELHRVHGIIFQSSILQAPLEKHHHDILAYINQFGYIRQRDYATFSTRSLASRKKDFEKLIEYNLIKSQGIGRGIYYVCAD